LSFSDGHGYKFVADSNSSTAYSYYAVADPAVTSLIIKSGDDYNNFVTARDILFAELGWASYEERIAVVETTFDKENNQFIGTSNTYENISQLYQSSPSLETFLGN
jgi:hypothetical protein